MYHTLISVIKTWVFKKRIKKFRKTKNEKLIIEKEFDTFSINILAMFAYAGIISGLIIISIAAIIFVGWLFKLLIESSNDTGGIIAIIVAILSMIGGVYTANKKRRDEKKDRYDNSLYIIMQYLIELKKGNYEYKIFKDDLSYIFMNIPNNVLFILRDIQDNIKNIKEQNDIGNIKYNEVIRKEILFLIIYIREFYKIANAELKNDLDHESMIEDIIRNSSSAKLQKKYQNKDIKKD